VAEAEELLRIAQLRRGAGAGLEADVLRAQASLASRQQDLALALNSFYEASIALSLILELDPAVTLVPNSRQIAQTTLIREDLAIDEMLALAVQWRPDLKSVRTLVSAAEADRGATAWGALGPQATAYYQFGGIASNSNLGDFSLRRQEHAGASIGWAFGLSSFGQIKVADSAQEQARIEAQRLLDQVRAQVIRADQSSRTSAKLIPAARRQVESAEEALRLAQANLRAGAMIELDALAAEDAVNDARVRYAQAVARYNQSQVNLLAAMGMIDDTSAPLPAAPLSADPLTAAPLSAAPPPATAPSR
jgi:outer membrane protein TolC